MTTKEQAKQLDKKCRFWGCRCTQSLEVHHIVKKSQQGPDELWNLITLCNKHHNDITEGRISDIAVLSKLRKKIDFRWQPALEWHLDRLDINRFKRSTIRKKNEPTTKQ